MKRAGLLDRVVFLAEARTELWAAGREMFKEGHSAYSRQQAEIAFERRAVQYGLACLRYFGGARS